MVDLAVLVPSRGRPGNIERLLDAMDKTCRADTRLVVGVDRDDPMLEEYEKLRWRCDLNLGDARLVEWLNILSTFWATAAPYLGHIGDDNVPVTVGWDVNIIESLERQGEIGFCFGNDLDPGRDPGALSIHIFMTSEVVRRLGYFGPPQIQHMYVDPVWFAWGKSTSIEFLQDTVIEHWHYSFDSRSPKDESYEASTGLIPADCANYNAYCEKGLNADIEKLGGIPFSPEDLAAFNRSLNIPSSWPG